MDLADLICWILRAYSILVLLRIIFSWFPISPNTAMASIYSVLYAVTEPVLGPIRRAIPPLGMGGMGLDLSPLVVFFGVTILLSVIGC